MGSNLHTGQRNLLQVLEDEQDVRLSTQLISGKLVQYRYKILFPALNSSKNSATIDYKTHFNTKFDLIILSIMCLTP